MISEGMNTGAGIWSEPVRFHSYDVDFKRRAMLAAVCRYFLEAAWNHAEQLGVGYTHLAKEGRFWVLSRLLVKVERFPGWGEEAGLNTWPRQPKGVFALRDFELVDASRRRMVSGVSAWLVLDAKTRRPQRLERLKWRLKSFPEARAVDREPEKMKEHAGGTEVFQTAVRYGDLDVNDHVNSTVYIKWLMDSYAPEFYWQNRVKLLEVNYLGETRAGDEVSVSVTPGPALVFRHTLAKASGEEVCRARVEWVGEAG